MDSSVSLQSGERCQFVGLLLLNLAMSVAVDLVLVPFHQSALQLCMLGCALVLCSLFWCCLLALLVICWVFFDEGC
jgi:hypothetical protein